MNTKNFITKIINPSQKQIVQGVRCLPELMSTGVISISGLLPLTSIPNRGLAVYAQLLQGQTTDPWYQSLEMAHLKVKAALSPGAFGNGVPDLHNLTANDILIIVGMSVLGGIITYAVVTALLKYINSEKLGRRSPLNNMI